MSNVRNIEAGIVHCGRFTGRSLDHFSAEESGSTIGQSGFEPRDFDVIFQSCTQEYLCPCQLPLLRYPS